MTAIKKLIDGNGNQYFPQTHTNAVIDDNGYSVESKMQAVQDVVNQAQMGIGAVPSDLTPTEDSTNWVTSGGVFNATTVGENVEIDLTEYTAVRAFPNPDIWVVTTAAYPYYGIFVPVKAGQKYMITANSEHLSYYGFLTTNTYSQSANVSYATGCTRVNLPTGETVIDTAPSDARYIWIGTYTTDDITPQLFAEYHKTSVKDYLNNIDATPVDGSANLVNSGGVYEFVKNECNEIIDTDYSFIITNNFTNAITATYLPKAITIENNDGVFTIQSLSSGGRAMINFPTGIDLTVGKEYILSFDYTCTANKTCWWWFSSSPGVEGTNPFSTTGTSGHKDIVFTYAANKIGFYTASSNFVGETVVVSNLSITTAYSIREKLEECSEIANTAIASSNSTRTQIEEVKGQVSLIGNSYDGNVSWKTYTGNPIIPQNRFGIKELCTFGSQGMAICNNIAFFFANSGNTFSWYNILNGESSTGCPLGFSGSGYHCNSASFSNVYYNENDAFPLLYIGGMEGDHILEVKVVRVVPSGNSYSASLIQTITIPSYNNVAIEGDYMYLNGDAGLRKCVIPPIFDSNDEPITAYTLTNEDILKTWTIYVPNGLQGCCIHNGVFYQLSNEGIMLVFDTITETEVNRVTMRSVGITYEQEDLDFSGDTMFLSCAGHFYRVWL